MDIKIKIVLSKKIQKVGRLISDPKKKLNQNQIASKPFGANQFKGISAREKGKIIGLINSRLNVC